MFNIKDVLGNKYLEKFRIFHEVTLFPPNWEALKQKRCVLCGNLLKMPFKGNIAYCHGKKHKKVFMISLSKLNKLV